MEREIRFINKGSAVVRPNLSEIHQAILEEIDNLLPTSLESLQKSFDASLATVLIDGDKAFGFLRFSPLLTETLKRKIGLETDFPDILEIGSAVILKDGNYRGKGYYPQLRNHLLESVVERVRQKKLLVLGTTKSIIVYKVLSKAKDLGIEFYPSVHTEFPMIAPFTCVCKPDFGSGFQLSTGCSKRVKAEQLKDLESLAKISPSGINIPCIMYVSDRILANDMSAYLKAIFATFNKDNPQQGLVERLKALKYYE